MEELDNEVGVQPARADALRGGGFIRDCAEMARASLFRTESRWGCTTIASTTRRSTMRTAFVHVNLRKDAAGNMVR